MVDEWFGHSTPEEQQSDRKTAILLRQNVAPRLASLKANASQLLPGEAEKELHNLRGSVGSFGFSACVEYLTALEKNWAGLSPSDRAATLSTACESFDAGLNELFQRFPHLRD